MARTPKVRIESIRQPGHFKDVELVYADILTKLKLYRRVDVTPERPAAPASPVKPVRKAPEPELTKPKRVYRRRDMQAEDMRHTAPRVEAPDAGPRYSEPQDKPKAK